MTSRPSDAKSQPPPPKKPKPAKATRAKTAPPKPDRGLFSRPLASAIALTPILVFHSLVLMEYEGGPPYLGSFLQAFGRARGWVAAGIVAGILVLAQLPSRSSWKVRSGQVGTLYLESLLWAVPLTLARLLTAPATPAPRTERSWAAELADGFGAGIYEELVFRAAPMTLLILVGSGILRLPRDRLAILAILLSALGFALLRPPPALAPFDGTRFIFESLMGLYLGAVFWFRGYGAAVGGHVVHHLMIGVVGSGGT